MATALIGGGTLGSCTQEPKPVDEPGFVRKIESEGLRGLGPERAARVGDYVLDNGDVRFVVQDPSSGTGWSLYGGSLVDLGAVGSAGPSPDLFEELFVQCDLRAFRPRTAEIVEPGGPGKDGVLRLVGEDAGIPYLDAVLPRDPLQITITVDLTLPASGRTLGIDIAAKDERKKGRRELSCGLVLLPGDAYRLYDPEDGFVDQAAGRMPYLAAEGEDGAASYVLARGDGEPLQVILPGLPFIPLGPPARPFLANATLRESYRLTVGDSSGVDGARRSAGFTPGAARAVEVSLPDVAALENPSVLVEDAVGAPVTAGVPDARGRVAVSLEPGAYTLTLSARDLRGALAVFPIEVPPGAGPLQLDAPALGLGRVTLRSRERGLDGALVGPTPARVRVIEGADAPVRGSPVYEAYVPAEHTFRLAPGTYTLVASLGPEHELHVETFDVGAEPVELEPMLVRAVDRSGWVSADLHVHGTRSSDSEVSKRVRVLGAAAEGVDILVSTDHDAVTDYGPTVVDLGLESRLRTASGTEVSPLYGHINGFPVEVRDPEDHWRPSWFDYAPDGRFLGVREPEELSRALRAAGAKVIQLNHPRDNQSLFGYLGLDPATGVTEKTFPDADALELINASSVDDYGAVLADVHGLMRAGRRLTVTGTSDVHGTIGVGAARTYVRLPGVERLEDVDLDAVWTNLSEGRAVASGGAFVEVEVEGDGQRAEPGQVLAARGPVQVSVRVQAPSWMTPTVIKLWTQDEVTHEVPIRAEDADPSRPALRFSKTLTATVTSDTYYMVEVRSEGGRPWVRGDVTATNPILVDADGDGFDLR